MRDKDLYAQILGISSPWQVADAELYVLKGLHTRKVPRYKPEVDFRSTNVRLVGR
jgi:hypothetical protein